MNGVKGLSGIVLPVLNCSMYISILCVMLGVVSSVCKVIKKNVCSVFYPPSTTRNAVYDKRKSVPHRVIVMIFSCMWRHCLQLTFRNMVEAKVMRRPIMMDYTVLQWIL